MCVLFSHFSKLLWFAFFSKWKRVRSQNGFRLCHHTNAILSFALRAVRICLIDFQETYRVKVNRKKTQSQGPRALKSNFFEDGEERGRAKRRKTAFSFQARKSICIIFIGTEWLPGWVCVLICFVLYVFFLFDVFFSSAYLFFGYIIPYWNFVCSHCWDSFLPITNL